MAKLARWDPFTLDLPYRMLRLFDDRPLFETGFDVPPLKVEEFVDDGTLVVRVEMPGVDVEKDVDISVQDGLLHIKATRSESSEKKEKAFYRSEFGYGAFERRLRLPPGATVDDVKATYADGVLEIRIPTAEPKVEARKVPIQKTF